MQFESNKKGSHRGILFLHLEKEDLFVIRSEHYLELSTEAGFNLAARDAGYHVASTLKVIAVPETTTTSIILSCDGKKSTK